jgi:cation:H+ antiporter
MLAAFALLAIPIPQVQPNTVFWAAPAILLAAMMIAWAAESAQFFIAQGFSLAILAWLQTLPEFAVEAVLAWNQQVPLMMANLTGALRLLTGLGWPMIYAVAAFCYRRRTGQPLRRIHLEQEHSVEVIGLLAPLVYISTVWWKGRLDPYDGVVLTAIYVFYLWILSRVPPKEEESIEEMEAVPRAILKSAPGVRNTAIIGLFVGGGALIYFMAEPFLASLLAVSTTLGISSFVFVQWVAPFVSEFPEKVSAFYWARTVERSSMALMNMVSSNINQWTLIPAMLLLVFSISVGHAAPIPFDEQQRLELLMTLGQSLVAMLFLVNMELSWWEALVLFQLWGIQFVLSPVPPGPGAIGFLAAHIHAYVTVAYFVWAGVEVVRMVLGLRKPRAFVLFGAVWAKYVRRH